MRLSRGFVAGVVGFLVAGSAVAGVGRADDAPPGDVVRIATESPLTVAEFLKAVSTASGVPILLAQDGSNLASRRVAVASPVTVRRERLLDAARAILSAQEIVLIPVQSSGFDGLLATDVRQVASQFMLKMKPKPVEVTPETLAELERSDGLYVTTVLRMQNLDDLRDARQALQRLLTQNNVGSVTEVPAARALLVTDFAPNVAAIYRAVRLLDVPRPRDPGTVREAFKLRYARAAVVRNILDEQFSPRRSVGVSAPAVPGAAAPLAPSEEPFRVSADDASSQVLVTCRESDLPAIRKTVETLDVPPSGSAPAGR